MNNEETQFPVEIINTSNEIVSTPLYEVEEEVGFFKKHKTGILVSCGFFVFLAAVATAVYFFVLNPKDRYCNVIPKNTIMLTRLNAKELLYDKGMSLNDIKDLADKMKIDGDEMEEMGIDLSRSIYAFVSEKKDVGIVAKVSDAEKLKQYLDDNGKDLVGDDVKFKESDGIIIAKSKDGYGRIIAFDNSKVLMLTGEGDQSDVIRRAKKLMIQDTDNSILDSPLYTEILDSKKGAALNIDLSKLPDEVYDEMESELNKNGMEKYAKKAKKAFKDYHYLFTFDTDGDKAILAFDVISQDEKAQKNLEKASAINGAIGSKLLDYCHQTPLLWGCININGSKLLKELEDYGIDNLNDIALGDLHINVENIIKSAKGDMAFSMDFGEELKKAPSMLFIADLSEDNISPEIRKYASTMTGNSYANIAEPQTGRFEYQTMHYSEGSYRESYYWDDWYGDYFPTTEYVPPTLQSVNTEAWFGTKSNIFYATNDAKMSELGTSSSAARKYKEQMKGCSVFMMLDIKHLTDYIKQQGNGNSDVETFANISSKFDNIIFSVKGAHAEMVLSTKKERNIFTVLKSLL